MFGFGATCHVWSLSGMSRLSVLLEHLSTIDDPRDVRRILHPLAEILFLVVCGTIASVNVVEKFLARARSPEVDPTSDVNRPLKQRELEPDGFNLNLSGSS
jgi:hypothetical protein